LDILTILIVLHLRPHALYNVYSLFFLLEQKGGGSRRSGEKYVKSALPLPITLKKIWSAYTFFLIYLLFIYVFKKKS